MAVDSPESVVLSRSRVHALAHATHSFILLRSALYRSTLGPTGKVAVEATSPREATP